MDAGMTLIGLAAIIAPVAIVAIVFGRGFKGQISPDKATFEVLPPGGGTSAADRRADPPPKH